MNEPWLKIRHPKWEEQEIVGYFIAYFPAEPGLTFRTVDPKDIRTGVRKGTHTPLWNYTIRTDRSREVEPDDPTPDVIVQPPPVP